jgi:ADP-L-glycero-D-manno-heptose 6-epimerase
MARRGLPKRRSALYKDPDVHFGIQNDPALMILVTGGAGFIGSNLVAALSERSRPVIVCDRLGQDDKWRNLAKHEIEDFVPAEELLDFVRRRGATLTAVVHLAAISDTTARDADALLANNFKLSQWLWDWCAGERKPFVYASSAATYGTGAEGFEDDMSASYLARLAPLNPYGWSKHLFDRWAARRLVSEAPRPPQWAGLKFFNVYGPNEYHKGAQASVASQLYRQITETGEARLFESHRPDIPDGGQKRDFVWVGDCVEVILWLLETPEVSGLFNLGSGRARSFAELAGAVFAALELPEKITYVPTPEALRESYQYFTEAGMERLAEAGYKTPFTSLEHGVAHYLRDYLATTDPYR